MKITLNIRIYHIFWLLYLNSKECIVNSAHNKTDTGCTDYLATMLRVRKVTSVMSDSWQLHEL